jgi:site-specific DNA-methyltransferase (adenine-specific)
MALQVLRNISGSVALHWNNLEIPDNPYYQDDAVVIYHANCRDILPLIPNKSVDWMLTSPPYNVGLIYGNNTDDKRRLPDFQKWTREWLLLCFNVLAESSRAYLVVGDKMKWWFKPLCESLGYKYHESLIWCKPNLIGASAGKISGDWNIMTEDILLFHKGKRTPMLKGAREMSTWNWFIQTTPQTNFKENYRYHPAQFPNNMVFRIIGRTPGDIILDPFLGSGTTAYCAKKLGRKAIGIEIEECYCEIAAQRCSQMVMDLRI